MNKKIELILVIISSVFMFIFVPIGIILNDGGLGIFKLISLLYYYIFWLSPIIFIYKSNKKYLYILLILINIIGLSILRYCIAEYLTYPSKNGETIITQFKKTIYDKPSKNICR